MECVKQPIIIKHVRILLRDALWKRPPWSYNWVLVNLQKPAISFVMKTIWDHRRRWKFLLIHFMKPAGPEYSNLKKKKFVCSVTKPLRKKLILTKKYGEESKTRHACYAFVLKQQSSWLALKSSGKHRPLLPELLIELVWARARPQECLQASRKPCLKRLGHAGCPWLGLMVPDRPGHQLFTGDCATLVP